MRAERGGGAGGARGGARRGRGGGGRAAVGRRAADGVVRGAGGLPAPAPRPRRQGVLRRAPAARLAHLTLRRLPRHHCLSVNTTDQCGATLIWTGVHPPKCCHFIISVQHGFHATNKFELPILRTVLFTN